MKPSRRPANFPGEAILDAINDLLNGAVFRLDGTTVVPVFDSFPKGFAADDWNFIEIADYRVIDGEVLGLYEINVGIGVYSSYDGYRELSVELDQVHGLLVSKLDLSAHNFDDVSVGGDSLDCPVTKLHMEENVVIRRGIYRRRWKAADTKY